MVSITRSWGGLVGDLQLCVGTVGAPVVCNGVDMRVGVLANVYKNKENKIEEPEYEECLSCQ